MVLAYRRAVRQADFDSQIRITAYRLWHCEAEFRIIYDDQITLRSAVAINDSLFWGESGESLLTSQVNDGITTVRIRN